MKRFQNRIAESWLTLPGVSLFVVCVWLLSGLVVNGWWAQLACMAVSTYLMAELSNSNALLRVRSRMVSATFLVFSATACFLFGSLAGGIVQLCFVAMFIILFRTYQDPLTQGWMFYAFLCLSLASLVWVQCLYYVPLMWLLVAVELQSLSWRSWVATLIALLTPYWFASLWVFYQQDVSLVVSHFSPLAELSFPYDYGQLSISQIGSFSFVVLLMLVGAIHFWNRSFEDRIRIRQFYGFFFYVGLFSVVFLVLQPQHFNALMRIVIVCAAPMAAHFFALTKTRATNVFFCVSLTIAVLLTAISLLEPRWGAISSTARELWNGLLNF